MKKIVTMLALIALALTGCNKDDDSSPSKVFVVKINGDDFEVEDIEGYRDGDIVEVYAEDDDENFFIISLDAEDIEEGDTYDLEAGGDINISYNTEDGEFFYPLSGEMKILKLSDTRLEATFEFDSENFEGDEMEFEDGEVRIPLEDD